VFEEQLLRDKLSSLGRLCEDDDHGHFVVQTVSTPSTGPDGNTKAIVVHCEPSIYG